MIPKYEEIMLPFLKYLADGKEHGLSKTHDALAEQFKLTDEELRELLPSGRQPVFRNRVGWARTYLKKAGLVTSPKRAHFRISDKGQPFEGDTFIFSFSQVFLLLKHVVYFS